MLIELLSAELIAPKFRGQASSDVVPITLTAAQFLVQVVKSVLRSFLVCSKLHPKFLDSCLLLADDVLLLVELQLLKLFKFAFLAFIHLLVGVVVAIVTMWDVG